MKRYFEFVNESFYSNLDDSELEEKLRELARDKKEIDEEISYINQILKYREDQNVKEFVKDWQKST